MTRAKKNPTYVAVGKRLREARLEAGLTQEQLAFEADLNPKYVGCVERGEKDISVARLLRLLAVLKKEPGDFFAGL